MPNEKIMYDPRIYVSVWDNQKWVNTWQALGDPLSDEAIEWIQNRPECIQRIMLKFPPSCLVKANKSLVCPVLGKIAIVSSYYEDGDITVRANPDSDIRHQCETNWLRVVGFWNGITPKVIKEILELKK